MPSEE
jgi:hypothetical protein